MKNQEEDIFLYVRIKKSSSLDKDCYFKLHLNIQILHLNSKATALGLKILKYEEQE